MIFRARSVGRCVGAISLCMLCACVTERVTPEGIPVRPGPGGSATTARRAPAAPATLPSGPLARPATEATMYASRVDIELRPIGQFSYDGQQLPLVSPDGSFLVTQEGLAPSWPTILAEDNASPSSESRLSLYDLTQSTPAALPLSTDMPLGVILGRSADADGFLVEWPRDDGTRWIGKARWAGSLQWLARDSAIQSHATLDHSGAVIYTRRVIGSDRAVLVLQTPNGHVSIKEPDDGTFAYPVAIPGGEVIYVFRLSNRGLDLIAFRVDRSNPAAPRIADPRGTWRITSQPDLLLAHQMASTALPIVGGEGGSAADAAVMFDPRRNRMARFNWRHGGVEPLAERSISAAPAARSMDEGFFCTAPDGLVFLRRPERGWPLSWPADPPVARTLGVTYVARLLRTDSPRYLLIGPVKDRPERLDIALMAVVPTETPPR
jgi:hypothetical protein